MCTWTHIYTHTLILYGLHISELSMVSKAFREGGFHLSAVL